MKKAIPYLLIVIVIGSLCLWWITRDSLPKEIRIATGLKGGMYHEFGTLLKKQVEQKTRSKVVVIETNGSMDNQRLLKEGKTDLAVIQSGSFSIDRSTVIFPLFYEPVIVISRSSFAVQSVYDLEGRKVHVGPDFSQGSIRTTSQSFALFSASEMTSRVNTTIFLFRFSLGTSSECSISKRRNPRGFQLQMTTCPERFSNCLSFRLVITLLKY